MSCLQYAIGPTTMLYLIMFFILPKGAPFIEPYHVGLVLESLRRIVFLNAMLAMLNARKSLRDQMVRRVVSVHPSTAFAFGLARHTTGSEDTRMVSTSRL